MKYTVIVGGNPYTVVAEGWDKSADGVVKFWDDNPHRVVAEFTDSKIDGIIMEDNNVS